MQDKKSIDRCFFTDDALRGYGFDLLLDCVIVNMDKNKKPNDMKFARSLSISDQYILNNHTYTHDTLRLIATRNLKDAT